MSNREEIYIETDDITYKKSRTLGENDRLELPPVIMLHLLKAVAGADIKAEGAVMAPTVTGAGELKRWAQAALDEGVVGPDA